MTAKRQYRILGAAMMAAALVLGMTACSSENDLAGEPKTVEEPTAQTQATVIHVTVGAGISDPTPDPSPTGAGSSATTRSTVDVTTDGETGKKTRTLQFSAGDKLYVRGQKERNSYLSGAEYYRYLVVGTLELESIDPDDPTKATFTGDLSVYRAEVEGNYNDEEGWVDFSSVTYPDANLVSDLTSVFSTADPLGECEVMTGTLIHEDAVKDVDYFITEDDRMVYYRPDCAATVEELMTTQLWVSGLYDSGTKSFALTKDTDQPIVNCTISGLEAGVSYKVDYIYGTTAAMSDHSRMLNSSLTATAGTLAFAFIAQTGDKFHGIRLTNTADAGDTYTVSIGQKEFESKVYNAARTAIGKKTPLTMEAITGGTIVVNNPKSGMQYRLNGGDKTPMTETTTIEVAKGDKVQFYGNGKNMATYISGGSATVKVYGNIMSLVDEEGFASATTLTSNLSFACLFVFPGTTPNDKLTDASGLLLPAETLTQHCYDGMFGDCTNLTAAPALPAKTLAQKCYMSMFQGCTSLTTAPELPATTLVNYCYSSMFQGCTSLTTAPELPATTLKDFCYQEMFKDCSSLSAVTCLATNKSATLCTNNWLSGVAATGTFTKAKGVSWSTSVSGIPSGWTVVNAQ